MAVMKSPQEEMSIPVMQRALKLNLNQFQNALAHDTIKCSEGKKYDSGKPEIEMVDPEFLEGLAKVLMFGKEKYDRNNWRGGILISRLISAAYRHLGAVNKGVDLDEESGLPHVYHLACCVMFLSWTLKHKPEMDDRWKP